MRSCRNIWGFWKKSQRWLNNDLRESAVMEKDEAVSWLKQRICGWLREVVENGGCWGWWSQTLLRLYTVWQVKFQKCVNDCFDVWSSFLYIPSSYQYIQHIECRVWNWMEYFLLCLCIVWKHIVYCLEHDYIYWQLASCFYSLLSPVGHQYSIFKEGKMQ
jgi:hypothetical protein